LRRRREKCYLVGLVCLRCVLDLVEIHITRGVPGGGEECTNSKKVSRGEDLVVKGRLVDRG